MAVGGGARRCRVAVEEGSARTWICANGVKWSTWKRNEKCRSSFCSHALVPDRSTCAHGAFGSAAPPPAAAVGVTTGDAWPSPALHVTIGSARSAVLPITVNEPSELSYEVWSGRRKVATLPSVCGSSVAWNTPSTLTAWAQRSSTRPLLSQLLTSMASENLLRPPSSQVELLYWSTAAQPLTSATIAAEVGESAARRRTGARRIVGEVRWTST